MIPEKLNSVTGSVKITRNLHGGDISNVLYISALNGEFVLKTGPENMDFRLEADGLQQLLIYKLNAPEVISYDKEYLLLKYYPPGRADFVKAGQMLAAAHKITYDTFGYIKNNFIGSLTQKNIASENWPHFYFQYRLFPLLARLGYPDRKFWELLSHKMGKLLPACVPSPLHGDLWTGNLYHSSQGPLFIDPSFYFGDRLVDLAMTRLFGGFPLAFYSAYKEIFPLTKEQNEIMEFYQTYPLLVHAVLFSGSYYQQAIHTASRFI